MGFSGSVNGTTRNPGFLDFGFCQCKWAYYRTIAGKRVASHEMATSDPRVVAAEGAKKRSDYLLNPILRIITESEGDSSNKRC